MKLTAKLVPDSENEDVLRALLEDLEKDELLMASLSDPESMRAVIIPESEVGDVINIIEGTKAIITDAINGTGVAQSAFKVWAWDVDNKAVLADASDFDLSDLAGVNIAPIAAGGSGVFIRAGRAVGALNGRGWVAGTIVYLSETPGELTDIAPEGVKVIIGQAEPTLPTDSGPANDLYIQPQLIG